MAQAGGSKRKAGRERSERIRASGCHQPPIGLLVAAGDLGPALLAVWDGAQGHAGGRQATTNHVCVYNPDAMAKRRSE